MNIRDELCSKLPIELFEALKEWLRDYGQPVAIFKAELRMWRDLCMQALLYLDPFISSANMRAVPDEHFPGINPINGERNWTTGRDLDRCRSQTKRESR